MRPPPAFRIGVEFRQLALGHTGGLAQVVRGVLRALFAANPDREFVVFCTLFNRGLLDSVPPNGRVHVVPTLHYVQELNRRAREVDVLFRGYPVEDDLDFPLFRQVFLVPDIQHEIFPHFFEPEVLRSRRVAFHQALAGAGAIGTLTEFTRQSIVSYPWTRCDDVFLLSPALAVEHQRPATDELGPAERASIPETEFFLYPANLWPHKNHRRVFQAFARFLEKTGRSMTFVCTGHPAGWSELREEFPHLPVRHLGFVRAELLRALLEKASALVFFSLYEGFGIPLLEAFNVNTPVICSNMTSLPEVGGDAVMTCDPADVEAMSELMTTIVQDEARRRQLVAAGRQRLGAFSWERSAHNLMEALDRVAARAETAGVRARRTSWVADARPLVSIVTPSLNQGRFLKETVESVLKQTYPRIEYLVVDGGSTDESVRILRSYGDRVRWTSEPDRGQAHAINKGLSRSSGEIRAYLNADDVLLPGAVERVVEYLRDHPDCDLVYGRAQYLDEHGVVTGMYETTEYSFARLMRQNCICQPAAFWRSRIGDLVGPFDEELVSLDYDYWLRLDRIGGRIEHIPDVLAAWRVHAGIKSLIDRERIYREIFYVCRKHGGYVDLYWIQGLWHHRIYEKRRGWPRWLRRLPGAYQRMAHLHASWDALRSYARRVASGRAFEFRLGMAHRIAFRGRPLRWTAKWLPVVSEHWPLYGYWSDNWLASTSQILVRNTKPGQELYLAGRAAIDTRLEIRAGRRVLSTHALRRDQATRIRLDLRLAPEERTVVTLSFSHSVRDPLRRRAFLLEDTNLFPEADTVYNPLPA